MLSLTLVRSRLGAAPGRAARLVWHRAPHRPRRGAAACCSVPPGSRPQPPSGARSGRRRALRSSTASECELLVTVPGGIIWANDRWLVDHCIGPLGVGTVIVKPRRHVVHVWDLEAEEAAELGRLLRTTAGVVAQLLEPDQVYVCLWSHADGVPGHIHFVVQPVTREQRLRHGGGVRVQVAMFEAGVLPAADQVERFAARARAAFAASGSCGSSRVSLD